MAEKYYKKAPPPPPPTPKDEIVAPPFKWVTKGEKGKGVEPGYRSVKNNPMSDPFLLENVFRNNFLSVLQFLSGRVFFVLLLIRQQVL